ncbi:hypothetical protein SAMN04487764_1684 [Gillisia sp. Hel1_33_143]|uniref:hypothetical protein n=1 Tax=Gillisia sp. Hel1_33_143 TaxID=1336796 RepID=UPI00087C1ADE|nr:hypothetical protein [Gillisia sp. Hel1_33_143]SDS20265.1 hypothetical protein SAMN04487764_1684 [Gillisia sp. Hel1_33_143]
MTRLNSVSSIFGIVLIILNSIVILQFGLLESRWLRIFTYFFFGILFFKDIQKDQYYLIAAFLVVVISDYLFICHSRIDLENSKMILGGISYIALVLHLRRYVKILFINYFQTMLFILVLALNAVMFYLLFEIISVADHNPMPSIIFILFSIALFCLMVFTFYFNSMYENKSSRILIIATLLLVGSDLTLIISSFTNSGSFYDLYGILFLIGIGSLVKFTSLDSRVIPYNSEEIQKTT